MRHAAYILIAITAVFIASLVPATAENVKEASPQDKAGKAMQLAADSAQKAAVARDTALNAVINALAARNDVETELLQAMRTNDKKKISSVNKLLKTAAEDAEEARELTEKVIEYTAESMSAAESAKEHAKRVLDAATDNDVNLIVKKAEQLSVTAQQFACKAEPLVEILKKKWLISPAITSPKAAISSQPEPVLTEKNNKPAVTNQPTRPGVQ